MLRLEIWYKALGANQYISTKSLTNIQTLSQMVSNMQIKYV